MFAQRGPAIPLFLLAVVLLPIGTSVGHAGGSPVLLLAIPIALLAFVASALVAVIGMPARLGGLGRWAAYCMAIAAIFVVIRLVEFRFDRSRLDPGMKDLNDAIARQLAAKRKAAYGADAGRPAPSTTAPPSSKLTAPPQDNAGDGGK